MLPAFGNHELRRITPAAIRAWISSMDGEGLSPSRIRQAVQVLHASLKQAVGDGLIGRNPATEANVPHDDHREMKFLTAEQVRLLTDAAASRDGCWYHDHVHRLHRVAVVGDRRPS